MSDDQLRLRYRRNFTIYQIAPYAVEWKIFIKTLLDWSEVAVDYWLQEVIPNSLSTPRLLEHEQDSKRLITYYQNHGLVRREEVKEFENFLSGVENFFEALNASLQTAFQETSDFRDFVESVVLHSLSALLKNLIARLGGVGSDDLVAYTDMPLLKQVDRTSAPRILIMDTVEGGSGGIAQAFERLDLTKEEGSLWWMLQNKMGKCSIGDGEALVKAVLSRATEEQIRKGQKDSSPDALKDLLKTINLTRSDQDAFAMLSRTLFRETEVAGEQINPALIMHKLFVLQKELETQVPGSVSRVATIRQAVSTPDLTYMTDLRNALANSGAVNELEYELGLQLLAIHKNSCDDGCPICLSATSDIEHHYLAPLLNSRRALKKLSEVLQKPLPRGDSLTDVEELLLSPQPVIVEAHPGQLADRLEPEIGLAIVANVDDEGQVPSSVAIPIDPQRAAKFLKSGDRWEKGKVYITPDIGHGSIKVRSKAEYVIATKLDAANIPFEYEPHLAYRDEQGHTRFMRPDFYLYQHELYIEYWGLDSREYIIKRKRKEKRYEELATRRNIRVLHLEPGDEKHDIFMGKILAAIGMSSPN